MSIAGSDDEFSDYLSDLSQSHENSESISSNSDKLSAQSPNEITNVAISLANRQLYGQIKKQPKGKTDKIFNGIHPKCRLSLCSLLPTEKDRVPVNGLANHVFMGFTLCGEYFISYKENIVESNASSFIFWGTHEWELYIWRFVPEKPLIFVSKHRIFKQNRDYSGFSSFMMVQWPRDPYRIVCYGVTDTTPSMLHLTILSLPFPRSCQHCYKLQKNEGWCEKHGFNIHYMCSLSQPPPIFDPHVSFACPDHIVINTGHYVHVLNVKTAEPAPQPPDEPARPAPPFGDTFSDVSESPSEFGTSGVVDAILEDFSEYDLEPPAADSKPFHELNISCEPLNATGKSYHNTLVQNIFDPRIKRLQAKEFEFSVPQTLLEKNKIDKNKAEKAYEFIEENEKCEKLSLFRKKRLAEKKYEFSEDNSENIVPFNSLRRDRRYVCRAAGGLFLSPRSPRSGVQFSPGRHLYCPSLRSHSNSPVSPKEPPRKFYAYSPSLDDWSDSETRLIQRLPINLNGLLIIDPKMEAPKWIKKSVRRYSNGDFENGSLVSGQSRDDFNIPYEIPLVVNTLTEHNLDLIPDYQVKNVTEMQLIVSQRTFDCELFVWKQALKKCVELQMEYLHCEDYDIKLNNVCPLKGDILCQVTVKFRALKYSDGRIVKCETITTQCTCIWNFKTDNFQVIDNDDKPTALNYSKMQSNVLVLDQCVDETKTILRDFYNCYEIYFETQSAW